jgi:hypothetical protein
LASERENEGVGSSLEIEKGKGRLVDGDKDNHIYRNPMPYEKITRHAVEFVPGLFKSSFNVALVIRPKPQRKRDL